MSQPNPPQNSLRSNPQVIAALIGGVFTLLVAIIGVIPAVLNRPAEATLAPTATLAPAATTTTLPPTASLPTVTPILPTPVPPTDAPPAPAGNVLLLYDSVSFSLVNQDTQPVSLDGVIFRSAGGEWEARKWGPGVMNHLPAGKCLRLRDAAVGQRQPPPACADLYGLMEVGSTALFWVGVEQFEVMRNGSLIATCRVAEASCLVEISS